MDINALRIAVTIISLVTFVGIVVWAMDKKKRARFDEAAHIPFDQE
jgi:cytochrome c oxidase cbb3-type subunit IV